MKYSHFEFPLTHTDSLRWCHKYVISCISASSSTIPVYVSPKIHFFNPQITQIKGEGSPANTKTVGQVKSNSKKCLKSQSPAPQISIRKDLTKASPNPSASKRSGGPVASPIPTKTTFLTQFNIPTPQSSPAAVENQNARRSSPRKLPSIQKPSIDCITIDDSN